MKERQWQPNNLLVSISLLKCYVRPLSMVITRKVHGSIGIANFTPNSELENSANNS